MSNQFFFGYAGNKRKETQKLYEHVESKLKHINTIIEPFCGTSAFSFYMSTKHPLKFNYILNDNNKHLIELYKIAKEDDKLKNLVNELNILVIDIDKIKYQEIIKKDLLTSWIIKNTIFAIRPGLFPNGNKTYY